MTSRLDENLERGGLQLAPFLAPMTYVRFRSSAFAGGRQIPIASLTCNNEPERIAVDDHRFLAKVGVAGSNPVVRSKTDS